MFTLLQDLCERLVGEAVILGAWLPIAPFYKKFVVLFDEQLQGSKAHRKQMLDLDISAAADDPTAIVEEYLNPWWVKPKEAGVSVADGLEKFAGKVNLHVRWYPAPG